MEEIHDEIVKLKENILHDYKYYERRYDTISMVFSGFGLYGCFEILKWYLTEDYIYSYWLVFPIMLWLVILFVGLFNIRREKKIRDNYMQQIIHISGAERDSSNEIRSKNIKLEEKLSFSRKMLFLLSILAVILMVLSLGCFLLTNK